MVSSASTVRLDNSGSSTECRGLTTFQGDPGDGPRGSLCRPQEVRLEKTMEQLAADAIRVLSMDGVQRANSGHPGAPMGMADLAVVLWSRFLRVDPADPSWVDRDRFVLSNGHASMLLYSLLHLSGFPISMDDIQKVRQFGSITPGHPEIDIAARGRNVPYNG